MEVEKGYPLPNFVIKEFSDSNCLILAIKPEVMGKILNIVNQCISQYYRRKVGLTKAQSQTGAVTLIQRFDGSINLNVHFHTLYIDGIYQLSTDKRPILFCPCVEPTLDELKTVLDKIIKKTISLLERRGFLVKDNEDPLSLSIDNEDTFSQIQASSAIYRFATGPNKGRKALVLKTISNRDPTSGTRLVATHSSFSIPYARSVRSMETYAQRSYFGFNLSKAVRMLQLQAQQTVQ